MFYANKMDLREKALLTFGEMNIKFYALIKKKTCPKNY